MPVPNREATEAIIPIRDEAKKFTIYLEVEDIRLPCCIDVYFEDRESCALMGAASADSDKMHANMF
jgi:hypothetical protein